MGPLMGLLVAEAVVAEFSKLVRSYLSDYVLPPCLFVCDSMPDGALLRN